MSRFPSNVRFEYDEAHSTNFTRGSWNKDHIVCHWWDDPSRRPTFDGVVSWFKNPSANVSIQYMVEANRITQMIPESAMAWHSGNTNSNRHGIGIEVNPRLNAGDYETTAVLVAEIWRRLGRKMPLRRHRDVNSSTACPGHMDISRIQRRAEQIYSGSSSAPATSTPVLEGETMSAEEFWDYNIRSAVSGNNIKASNMLRNAHGDANVASQRAQRALDRNFWDHNLRVRTTGDNIKSGNMLRNTNRDAAYARQESRASKNEAREVKSMVKAMASTLDELLDGQGKILKAVEDAERTQVDVNIAEVNAEVQREAQEDQEEEG